MISKAWVSDQKDLWSAELKNHTQESKTDDTDRRPSGIPTMETFVSTNDLLTSCYFRFTDTDVGFMSVNFRNRIPGLTDDYAGNYEGGLAYQRGDYESPALIRSSLSTLHRSITDGPLLPGFSPDSARTSVSSRTGCHSTAM